MEGWKDIWEKAAYIALRLIATLSIMCNVELLMKKGGFTLV